jgi:tetratricopeptide (TPR) repeat protein
MLGGPGSDPMLRGPRSTMQGPSPMPSPMPMQVSPMQVSVPAPMPGPLRDMSPHVPPVPSHMPTMAADLHGIGGHTPGSYPPLPLMPTGYSPYPPTPAYSPYPPPPAYSSGAGPAPPRFQYPNGVMSAAPPNDRRKLLIGILGIAFVAVSAGIVMALVHGLGEEGEQEGGVAASQPAAGTAPAADGTVAPAATGTDAPAATGTDAPTAAPLPTPTATPLPADPTATAAGGTTATTDGAGPRLASLYGDKQLNAAVFGTDEQFLSDQPAGIIDDGPPPTESGKPEKDRAEKPDKSDRKVAEVTRRERKERQVEEDEEEEEEADDEEEDVRPSGDASAARRQAAALYKQKQFSEAAAVLRRSADGGGKRDAASLRSEAGKFEQIGSLLSQAEKARSDPAKALESFKKAKRLDEEYGDGTHDGFIGARIGQVAPQAAGSHMARKRWAEAKRAADDAETYGAGDQVERVRTSLSDKAESLYDQANELAQEGKTSESAELAKQIMKMVPKSSAIYGKASKLAK